jgi:uncharacterized protein
MTIIDSHCHAGKGDGLTGPWDTSATLTRFLAQSTAAGIHQTVLFPAFHSDYAVANAAVAEIVASNRKRFYGFAFVNAKTDKGRIFDMVRTAIEQYGFIGIKAHRHDGRITREVCEVAQFFNIPILYDVSGEITIVELLATEYPTVNFIIPHLSTFADDWRVQLSFVPLLERHANIFTDTSGVRHFDLLEMAVQRAGAHKILFGTDGPWMHPNVELEKVFSLQLSEADTQLILADNFLRLTKSARKNFNEQPTNAEIEGMIRSNIGRVKGIDNARGSKTSDHAQIITGKQPKKFWQRAEKHVGQAIEKATTTRQVTTIPSNNQYRSPDFYRSSTKTGLQRIEVTSRAVLKATLSDTALCGEMKRAIKQKIDRGQLTWSLTTFEGNKLPSGGIIVIVIQKNDIPISRLKMAATCALQSFKRRSENKIHNIILKFYDQNSRKYGILDQLRATNVLP